MENGRHIGVDSDNEFNIDIQIISVTSTSDIKLSVELLDLLSTDSTTRDNTSTYKKFCKEVCGLYSLSQKDKSSVFLVL